MSSSGMRPELKGSDVVHLL